MLVVPLRRIIVVGGGVGGLKLVTKLCEKLAFGKKERKKAKVILVDKNPKHIWKPMLHRVATGSLDEDIDAISYLVHAYNYRFHFQLGSLKNINRENKTITIASHQDENGKLLFPERKLEYDALVIALGSTSNDFSVPGVKEHCIFLDGLHQARRFRKEMMNLFTRYSNGLLEGKNKINIAIVGGGPTGVELSAELYNTVKYLHKYGYKELTNNVLNVTLVEAGDRILPTFPYRISCTVYSELTKLGIQVLTNTLVSGADGGGLYTEKNGYIRADLMIWAAGIKAPDFMKNIGGLETNSINQLIVKPTLQTTRDPNIFAIGDCASCARTEGGFVPPRAQSANQMASLVLRNILEKMQNNALKVYSYRDFGSLVSLSNCSSIGYLMNNLMRSPIVLEGCVVRLIHIFLYRLQQIALHGYIKTILIILADNIGRFVRPNVKID